MPTIRSYSSPRRAVSAARREPISTALLLASGAVAVQAIHRGALPSAHEVADLAVGAGALVLLASVAPSVVTMGAGVLFLLAVLNGGPALLGVLDRAGHSLDTLGG